MSLLNYMQKNRFGVYEYKRRIPKDLLEQLPQYKSGFIKFSLQTKNADEAIGFNSRYVVGVWLGNLDGTPMDGVTGSTGPALVLRSVFADLARDTSTTPLYLSPKLIKRDICIRTHTEETKPCFMRTEYFMAGSEPSAAPVAEAVLSPALLRPTNGLFLAYDPRIPPDKQAFEFLAQGIPADGKASWLLNGQWVATTNGGHYLWPLYHAVITASRCK